MHLCNAGLVLLAGLFLASPSVAADFALGEGGAVPKEAAPAIAKLVDAKGLAIKSGDESVAHVWFVKSPPLAATPSAALGVNYRFSNGQLMGLLHVTGQGEFGDFRAQKVKAGVYTLRYGLQPQDGNHIGTSETADFLLALPAQHDKDPKPLDFAKLTTISAKSVSSSHPAIFSLLTPGKTPEKATLGEQGEFQVLNVPLAATLGDKAMPVGLRVVVVGHGDE